LANLDQLGIKLAELGLDECLFKVFLRAFFLFVIEVLVRELNCLRLGETGQLDQGGLYGDSLQHDVLEVGTVRPQVDCLGTDMRCGEELTRR
jgi:hypothetical protein